ncbi:glycosyltransferase [bacterium]|nr:glycosyltransferase [bacterium]
MSPIVNDIEVMILSSDVIGSKMAGPGIRYLKMAKNLARRWSTVLACPQAVEDTDLPCPFVISRGKRFWSLLDHARVIVTQGYNFPLKPILNSSARLIIDLYDPLPFEILGLKGQGKNASERMLLLDWTIRKTNLLMKRGDVFLYATPRQRDFWLGNLLAVGRINHELIAEDPLLNELLIEVPFGLDGSSLPELASGAIKGVMPGISRDDCVFYWGGGLWDWLDPGIVIQATARATREQPQIKTVFLAGRHPNPAVEVRGLVDPSKELAKELGVLNSHVFFHEQWVPFEQRISFLRDADVGLSFHGESLEAAYSFRTRILDYLWAGLPILASTGDGLSDLIVKNGAGFAVKTGDVEELARNMVDLARSAELRHSLGQASRSLSAAFDWDVVLTPLNDAVERMLMKGPGRFSSGRVYRELAGFYLTNLSREIHCLGLGRGLAKIGGRLLPRLK